MFNVTGGEVLIILVVALIVLGPEKLPDMIRKAGRLYGELRRMSNGFQSELREAFEEPTRELRETAELARNAVTGAVTDLTTSVNEMVRPDLSSTTDANAGAGVDAAAPATITSATGTPATADVVNPDLAAAIAAEAAEAGGIVASVPAPEPGALVGAATDTAASFAPPPLAMAPPSVAAMVTPVVVAPSPAALNGVNGSNGHGALSPPLAMPAQFAPPRPLPSPSTNGAAVEGDDRQPEPAGLRPPMAPPGGR